MRAAAIVFGIIAVATPLLAQKREADAFEIARAEEQTRRGDAASKIAGHLNLGDLHAARNDRKRARSEYSQALALAEKERLRTRAASDLSGYARATAHAGLAAAKLDRREESWSLFEESLRYTSDSASQWNLYSSAMSVAGKPSRAAAAARNAVAIAERDGLDDPARLLDLNVYRYSLAGALMALGHNEQARTVLETVVASLTSSRFDRIREQVRSNEKFEILSTVSADADAYLTLLARSRLRLGEIHERSGEVERAKTVYRQVLAQRNDETHALAALARLERSDAQFAEAFDANPFSWRLVQSYREHLRNSSEHSSGTTEGGRMRALLEAMNERRWSAARSIAAQLAERRPENDVLDALRAEIELASGDRETAENYLSRVSDASIRRGVVSRATASDGPRSEVLSQLDGAVLDENRITQMIDLLRRELEPNERTTIDEATLFATGRLTDVNSDGTTTAASGVEVGRARLRFPEPVRFQGDFSGASPVKLTMRILGGSEDDRGTYLLVEPIGVSR